MSKEPYEVTELKALIASEFIDEKIRGLLEGREYKDLNKNEQLKLNGLILTKNRVPIRVKA